MSQCTFLLIDVAKIDNLPKSYKLKPITSAKHRKGAVGIKMLKFRGEYTRFENPEDSMLGNRAPTDGGEIVGSKINGEDGNMPFPPPNSFDKSYDDVKNGD